MIIIVVVDVIGFVVVVSTVVVITVVVIINLNTFSSTCCDPIGAGGQSPNDAEDNFTTEMVSQHRLISLRWFPVKPFTIWFSAVDDPISRRMLYPSRPTLFDSVSSWLFRVSSSRLHGSLPSEADPVSLLRWFPSMASGCRFYKVIGKVSESLGRVTRPRGMAGIATQR